MSRQGGLGDVDFAWERDQAAKQLWQPSDTPEEPSDQGKQKQSKSASKSASKRTSKTAKVPSQSSEEDKPVTTSTAEEVPDAPAEKEEPPPPPPKTPPRARTQFNHRILLDRFERLDQYKRDHNTTMQAIVDQMVDEYLKRRGLLEEEQ